MRRYESLKNLAEHAMRGHTLDPSEQARLGRKAFAALAELEAAMSELDRIRAAVRAHYDQRGDDRCYLDDQKLYREVLGVGTDPYVGALPPDDDMLESCRRYIRHRRCPGPEGIAPLPGDMTIQQLTEAIETSVERSTFRFIKSEEGDWRALYRDGRKIAEGHQISARDLLKALDLKIGATVQANGDSPEFPDRFPEHVDESEGQS